MFKTRDQCRTQAFNSQVQDFFIHSCGQFSTQNLSFRHLIFLSSFSHSFLHSPCSSFSPYTSPTNSSNLSIGATTQTHRFIISWHQHKNPNPKITISAPEQLPKLGFAMGLLILALERLGFVDLSTGTHLGLMFQSSIVAWFVLFCFFVLFFSLQVSCLQKWVWSFESLRIHWGVGEVENREGKNGLKRKRNSSI